MSSPSRLRMLPVVIIFVSIILNACAGGGGGVKLTVSQQPLTRSWLNRMLTLLFMNLNQLQRLKEITRM